MSEYVLAAEADKIQDLIFRSARLREVIGGSQLLNRFCKEVLRLFGIRDNDILISDAGSFRILFETEQTARSFAQQLADVYRLATGGTLTVAEPVPVNGDFGRAVARAEEKLRRAKLRREDWQSQEHLPYMALCSSCGSGVAVTRRSYQADEKAEYLCRSCHAKALEYPFAAPGEFLREFYRLVVASDQGVAEDQDLQRYEWPGKHTRHDLGERDPLEDIADYDPGRHVAYLVADGNNMGDVVGSCTLRHRMRELSRSLPGVIRQALAEPTKLLMVTNPLEGKPNFIPVLPLILGGDDVFVALPAPWAIDFARRFCQEYERQMQEVLHKIDLKDIPGPTVSAATIVAKSRYPYYLAHEIGQKRVKEAKVLGKRPQLEKRDPVSMLNFEIIVGGLEPELPRKRVRPTLRPYIVADGIRKDWGLSVSYLIEQRLRLCSIARKRLAELKHLFDPEELPASMSQDDVKPWRQRLEWLLERIGRNAEHRKRVTEALQVLGRDGSPYWREVRRPQDESSWNGHGLPDLLEAWDFTLNMDKPRRLYEEGE